MLAGVGLVARGKMI